MVGSRFCHAYKLFSLLCKAKLSCLISFQFVSLKFILITQIENYIHYGKMDLFFESTALIDKEKSAKRRTILLQLWWPTSQVNFVNKE